MLTTGSGLGESNATKVRWNLTAVFISLRYCHDISIMVLFQDNALQQTTLVIPEYSPELESALAPLLQLAATSRYGHSICMHIFELLTRFAEHAAQDRYVSSKTHRLKIRVLLVAVHLTSFGSI